MLLRQEDLSLWIRRMPELEPAGLGLLPVRLRLHRTRLLPPQKRRAVSDAAARTTRRRANAGGSIEDRARVLVERVRTGSLTRRYLELAAFCGDEAAWLAVGPCDCGLGVGNEPGHDPHIPSGPKLKDGWTMSFKDMLGWLRYYGKLPCVAASWIACSAVEDVPGAFVSPQEAASERHLRQVRDWIQERYRMVKAGHPDSLDGDPWEADDVYCGLTIEWWMYPWTQITDHPQWEVALRRLTQRMESYGMEDHSVREFLCVMALAET